MKKYPPGALIFFFYLLAIGLNAGTPYILQHQSDSVATLRNLIITWNQAHNEKDVNALQQLYGASVFFYGKNLSGEECIQHKWQVLEKHAEFSQVISEEINVVLNHKKQLNCIFTKSVKTNGKWKHYPSYLVFALTDDGWKIITESDEITDRTLAKQSIPREKKGTELVKGDFDGDGIKEYMWLILPNIENQTEYGCQDICDAFLHFSNKSFPVIKIIDCIDGIPRNLGDLNSDGNDEIGLLPGWFMGCWRSFIVWTFRDGKWIKPVDPISTHCMLWDVGEFPIVKHPNKPGYVTITWNTFENDDIRLKKKVVKMR